MITFLAFLFGLVTGSFLNVCIYRIPRGESVVTNSSHCPVCNTYIKWYDLIPVLSYILLKGKCRSCKTSIGLIYPAVEILNGLVWALIFTFVKPLLLSFILSAVVSTLIVLIMVYKGKKGDD